MVLVRRIFGILLLGVSIILVFSIVITSSALSAYLSLVYSCLTQGCGGDVLKDGILGVLTYLFMAFMVYYLGRRGFIMLSGIKPEGPEPTTILDEDEFAHTRESINYFQTRYGYCHILPDRIIFANTKTLEDISGYKEGNKVIGAQALQLVILFAMSYYIYVHYKERDFWQLLTPVIMVVVSCISFFTSLRNSTTALIMREQIGSVKFVKGFAYFVTPHFIIWFRDAKNRKRKRVITIADASEKNISEVVQLFRTTSIDPL